MTKKTLEEKIELVWIWALILSVVYFAIGAYLKSDGPKFDPSKTYELLKDTLTITASFLAPVAAFVLFSDWRLEHVEKKVETDSESIVRELNAIFLKLYEVRMTICTEKTRDEDGALEINKVNDLLQVELLIVSNNIQRLKSVKDNTSEFEKLAKALVVSLGIIRGQFFKIQNAYHTNYLLNKPYNYLTPLAEISRNLDKNKAIVTALSVECEKLQVK